MDKNSCNQIGKTTVRLLKLETIHHKGLLVRMTVGAVASSRRGRVGLKNPNRPIVHFFPWTYGCW
ncbi:MAG: hypothetical protein ACLT2Z_06845 [Eubacterium sp.]